MGNEDQSEELSDLLELDTLYREMEDEQAAILRLVTRITKSMSQAAFAEFPALKQMSPEDFRKFGDILNRTATDFAVHSSNFAFHANK